MKKKLVVSSRNLQTRSPISLALLFYLLFDKWDAPMWLYGAFGTLFLLWLIALIVDIVNSESIDIFKGWTEGSVSGPKPSKFRQRLEKLKKERES